MPLFRPPQLSLRVPRDLRFVPAAAALAENAGEAFGFGTQERYHLRLSVEDGLEYLCAVADSDQPIEIDIRCDVYCMQLRFRCRLQESNLRILNLTAKTPVEKGEATRDLELFTVSRIADRLWLERESDGRVSLSVVIDRVYAEATKPRSGEVPPALDWHIVPAGPESIQLAAAMAVAHHSERQYPAFFRFPGKSADVIASGDWQAAMAKTSGGEVAGVVLWTWNNPKMVELSGPLLFPRSQPPAIAAALVDHVIRNVARTPAIGIVSRSESLSSAPAGFEVLGTLAACGEEAANGDTFSYRALVEDSGAAVFCRPALEEFLRREYARLVLPRKLHATAFAERNLSESSVLICDFRAGGREVLLRPVTLGTDARENLIEHQRWLHERGTAILLFELDLGVPWQSALAPILLDTGFMPRMVVPHGGISDTVLFQYVGLFPCEGQDRGLG
jgi:hypothetical protein